MLLSFFRFFVPASSRCLDRRHMAYGAQFTTTSSLNKPISSSFRTYTHSARESLSEFGFAGGEQRAVIIVGRGGVAGEGRGIRLVAALAFQRYTSRRWRTG